MSKCRWYREATRETEERTEKLYILARNVAFVVARQSSTFKLVAICRDGVQLPGNGIRTCSRHKIPNNKKMGGKGGGQIVRSCVSPLANCRRLFLVAQ